MQLKQKTTLLAIILTLVFYLKPAFSANNDINNSILPITLNSLSDANDVTKKYFLAQIFINVSLGLLEYLEILNLYNCTRWACSSAPISVFSLTLLNYLFFYKKKEIMIPSIITNFFVAGGSLFWDIEYWNISTRHRTEYYDTHAFNAGILWINTFWAMAYTFYLQPRET